MRCKKANFFDTQACEAWARDEYTLREISNLQSVINDKIMPTGSKILEPGCGTGRLTELMSRQVGPDGNVVALDMSHGMIQAGKHRLRLQNNVRLIRRHFEDTNLPQRDFDAVVCHNVFHHFRDKLAAIRQIADTLKPHGRFIIHHFLEFEEINNMARKVSELVYNDLIPSPKKLQTMISDSGLRIAHFSDSDDGFFVKAVKI